MVLQVRRRDIFKALAGAPLAATATLGNTEECVYTGSGVQCSKCGFVMMYFNSEHQGKYVQCGNGHCERYGIRYKAPTTTLEKL